MFFSSRFYQQITRLYDIAYLFAVQSYLGLIDFNFALLSNLPVLCFTTRHKNLPQHRKCKLCFPQTSLFWETVIPNQKSSCTFEPTIWTNRRKTTGNHFCLAFLLTFSVNLIIICTACVTIRKIWYGMIDCSGNEAEDFTLSERSNKYRGFYDLRFCSFWELNKVGKRVCFRTENLRFCLLRYTCYIV